MKASLPLLNAVILAVICLSSFSEGAPSSPYASCKDGSSLCFGLGTAAEVTSNVSSSCLTGEHCTFFFRSTFNAQSGFSFSLVAPSLPADRYVAVAFSNETGMAGLVVQCFHSSVSSKNIIEYSFNKGYHNEAIADQRSVTGFTSASATYANGGLTCAWSAPASGLVAYKGHEDFALLTSSYYLKLATGAVNASTGAIHRHAMHDASGRVASSAAVNLSKTKGIVVAKEVHHKNPPSPGTGPSPQDSHLFEASPYDQCKANTALCFGLPEGCTATGTCTFFFRSTYNSASGFTFSLIAPSIASDHYIAVAFSPQSGMSGLVVQCFHSGATNTIQYSFNKGYDNELITDPSRDLKGFTKPVTNYQNGQLNCQWAVPVGGKVAYKDNSFDFEHTKYYLKVATGAVKSGSITKHAHDGRMASKTALSLKATGTVHGGGASAAIKWHASLMIFGWVGCVTVAILMARFTRDLWPERKLFGTKYWFVVHRYLMILGWLAIVASYITIFVQFGGWTHTSPHSVMGIVAGVLATLQIGNSFLRPAPDSPRRWIFDYGHWFIGNSAHILALSNIINSGLKRGTAFIWLLLGYLFVYLLFSDLLKKLENRIRASSFSKRTPVVLQTAVAGAILTVIGITTALIAIMFTS